ncbi:MAG: hypothetical protein JWM80_519 [Cyanobacteria bacterium RYN_339]|nr:hypothetical protein [Cyanobacteria bacterium RYN_339]
MRTKQAWLELLALDVWPEEPLFFAGYALMALLVVAVTRAVVRG